MARFKTLLAFAIASMASTPLYAASCLDEATKAPAKDIEAFIADPSATLKASPVGGLSLSNLVRSLVASSSDTLAPVVTMAKGANEDQSKSIGSGLARAVAVCSKIDAAYADSIQQAVASLENPQVIASFAAASDEIRTASIGIASAGPGGGTIGGVTGLSADNGYRYPGDITAKIAPFEFSASATRQVLASGN